MTITFLKVEKSQHEMSSSFRQSGDRMSSDDFHRDRASVSLWHCSRPLLSSPPQSILGVPAAHKVPGNTDSFLPQAHAPGRGPNLQFSAHCHLLLRVAAGKKVLFLSRPVLNVLQTSRMIVSRSPIREDAGFNQIQKMEKVQSASNR
jgi:hypothetical protein